MKINQKSWNLEGFWIVLETHTELPIISTIVE